MLRLTRRMTPQRIKVTGAPPQVLAKLKTCTNASLLTDGLGRSQCADHDVVSVGVAKCELHGSGVGIHIRLLFESCHERASSRQRVGKIIYTEEQKQTIARLSAIGAGQRRMLVGSPLVEAKQDGPIFINNLAEIIMGGRRFRLSE